jgi:hypothetical protein
MYLGYGSAMEDVGQKRFEQFDRTADGFFTKISYTFRADR